MKAAFIQLILCIMTTPVVFSQHITPGVPDEVDPNTEYLFYLHGAIVQMQGIHAVSPQFGPYKYLEILDTFTDHGFHVISERRPKDTRTSDYASLISGEINELLSRGVPAKNITVVGASMGAGITLDIAVRTHNKDLKYALLGVCREESWRSYLDQYSDEEILFSGHFFSIYEKSDFFGTCSEIIGANHAVSSFQELALDMGIGHGFLFQPYDEWVLPLIKWVRH